VPVATHVTNDAKGTSTGIPAHSSTHTASMYLRMASCAHSSSRTSEAAAHTEPSSPSILTVRMPCRASPRSRTRMSLAVIMAAVARWMTLAM